MPRTRLAGEFRKIRSGTKAGLRLCRLPVRPQGRSGPTDTGPLAEPSGQNTRNTVTTGLSGPAVHVSDRFTNSHRKASSPRLTPYRPTITQNITCSANLYRRIKRRVGHSLKRMHCKRHLVPSGKQAAYQLPRTQGSLSSLKRVPRPLHTQDSTCSNRQHHSCVIHKQGRRHEVGPTLCSTMENLDLVHQKPSNSQSPTHSRPAECGSRQAIQARPDKSGLSFRRSSKQFAAGGTNLK